MYKKIVILGKQGIGKSTLAHALQDVLYGEFKLHDEVSDAATMKMLLTRKTKDIIVSQSFTRDNFNTDRKGMKVLFINLS